MATTSASGESAALVRLLGPLEIIATGGEPVSLPPRPASVVATVALAAGAVVTTGELIDTLSPEGPPGGARNSVQVHVSEARRRLGSHGLVVVETVRAGYRLGSTVRTDIDDLDRLVTEARTSPDPADAVDLLAAAVALWRGHPLAELVDRGFAHPGLVQLAERRVSVAEAHLDALLAIGRLDEVVARAERLVGEHPYREGATSRLAAALYRTGRQTEALRSIAGLRERLRVEIGVDPGPSIAALERTILDRSADALATWEPDEVGPTPVIVPEGAAGGQASMRFVGRRVELRRLRSAVQSNRLTTVVGPGGIGKTSLVAELGRTGRPGFPVHFADLAPHADQQGVTAEVAAAVGLTEISGDPVEAIVEQLSEGPVTLLVDNCEHVVDIVAGLVSTLLGRCPQLRVVATSRQPIGVPGERRLPLGPMESTVDGAELVRLRARQGGASAAIEPRDAEAVCRAVDGLPLAIELAAGWLRVLTPAELVDELAGDMTMLDEQAGASSTMARTIDRSLSLLPDDIARAVCELCVFPAGFTIEQATSFLGRSAVRIVARLHEASLVYRVDESEPARFRILEPIRGHGLERIHDDEVDESAAARQARVMVATAASIAAGLPTAHERAWRSTLSDELPNLVAATRWAARHQPRLAVELAASFTPLISFLPAGAARLAVIVTDEADWSEWPDGLAVAAMSTFAQAYLDASQTGLDLMAEVDRAVADADGAVDPSVMLFVAAVRTVIGDPAGAIAGFAAAGERADAIGHDLMRAEALMLQSAWSWFAQAPGWEEPLGVSTDLAYELGGPSLISLCEVVAGFFTVDGSPLEAEHRFRRATAAGAPTGYGPGVAEFMLGVIAARRGERTAALDWVERSIVRFRQAGLQIEVGMAMAGLVATLVGLEEADAAASVAATVRTHFSPIAAMPGFGRFLDAADRMGGRADRVGGRAPAVTEALALIARLR